MRVIAPDFYKAFHCKANLCTDTCCIGWEIDIDESTREHYKLVQGAFGEKLNASIKDGHIVLKKGDRCPFLDKYNFCEIYKNLGENFLSDICREHPRFVEVFGDIKEQGLGLSCEEAVNLLLKGKGRLQFIEFEDSDDPYPIFDEEKLERDKIFAEREKLFSIIFNTKNSLQNNLKSALEFVAILENKEEILQNEISFDKHSIIEILEKCESYGFIWDKAFKRMKQGKGLQQDLFSDEEGARISAYMVYRYYAKSLFDCDRISKMKFVYFFWNVLSKFGKELAPDSSGIEQKIDSIKLLSKQLEYSEENMDIFKRI